MKFNGTVEYTLIYDANGRLYSMTEGSITHVYEYDSLDRLIRAYQKDENGNIIVAVENTYDELGRAKGSKYENVSVSAQQYSIDYKEDSNLISTYTMPGNKVNTYTYDTFERLIQKSHSSNAFITSYTYLSPFSGRTSTVVSGLAIDTASTDIYYDYIYDNLGNITAVYKNGVLTEAYEYDVLGQLTRADNVAADSTVFYQYDKSGNILYKFEFEYTSESTSSIALAAADSIVAYQYTTGAWGDMLTRYGYNGTTINYDAIGNPLSWRNASSLTWEARQLESAVLSETDSIAFEYDSSGIRTRKTYTEVGGNTWDYEYILDGTRILRENIQAYPTDMPGAGIVFSLLYYYDDSGIASIDYEGTRYYYVKNLQGDVIGLVNGSGQFVVQYTYDAWGKVISTTGSMASTLGQYNPFRYRGYYYDRESGWYYLQSRYYDPTVGRFLNADTVGVITASPNGLTDKNLYAYCDNNPVIRVDNGGQFWDTIFAAVTIVATAVAVVAATVVTCGVAAVAIGGSVAVAATSVTATATAVGIFATKVAVVSAVSTVTAHVVEETVEKVEQKTNERDYSVYHLVDDNGDVQYVGRTKSPEKREAAHKANPNRKHLHMRIVSSDLTYAEARAL